MNVNIHILSTHRATAQEQNKGLSAMVQPGQQLPGDGGKDHGDPQGRVTAQACPTPRQEQHPKLGPYWCHNHLIQVHKFLEKNNFNFLIIICLFGLKGLPGLEGTEAASHSVERGRVGSNTTRSQSHVPSLGLTEKPFIKTFCVMKPQEGLEENWCDVSNDSSYPTS